MPEFPRGPSANAARTMRVAARDHVLLIEPVIFTLKAEAILLTSAIVNSRIISSMVKNSVAVDSQGRGS